jgi:hypothetical protein
VFAVDEFWNHSLLNINDVTFVADESRGYWRDGKYTPKVTGKHVIEARYGEFSVTRTIFAYELAQLQPNRTSVSLFEGQRIQISFTGISTDGTSIPVPTEALERFRVSSSRLGHMYGSEFVATGAGVGYIAARLGNIRVFIPLSVNGFPRAINMHGGSIAALSAPAETVVNVSEILLGGSPVIRIEYTFEQSSRTQAAYVAFDPPLEIPGDPAGLRLQVHGDGSGHWLRARVQDAEGRNHIIDFTRNADFFGWQHVIARLPDADGPFTIDQIYMVTLSSYEVSSHQVFFFGLEALYAPTDEMELPADTQFQDNLRAPEYFAGIIGGNFYEFEVPFVTEAQEDDETEILHEPAEYSARAEGSFSVITMTAQDGGIFAADSAQWRRFMRDIRFLNAEYVLILMDANPLYFNMPMEFELFHLAMQDLRDEGRLVFVVSAAGEIEEDTTLTMRDGVRYINLARREDDTASILFWTGASGEILWQ